MSSHKWPLMANNITDEDREALIAFLLLKGKRLTQSQEVRAFEQEWSQWLGVKHSVFVNSGASANMLTMRALRELYGPGEVIVPTITWVSDIASVVQAGLEPVFVDIDLNTLGMDHREVIRKITPRTRAVFITHVLGFSALCDELMGHLLVKSIPLIEDCCEAHGAVHHWGKVGSFGEASNFSFYYAHHMSTIEGGMICTNSDEWLDLLLMLRSHGMVREASEAAQSRYAAANPLCHPEFIFAYAGYNVRGTELNAVLGRTQLKRVDAAVEARSRNMRVFFEELSNSPFRTAYNTYGSSNYAFPLVLWDADPALWSRVLKKLNELGVEFRRGLSGGGNQLRQPYARKLFGENEWKKYPMANHVSDFGLYLGNYPGLTPDAIQNLCKELRSV